MKIGSLLFLAACAATAASLVLMCAQPAHAGEVVMHMHSSHNPEISETTGKPLSGWNPGIGYIADNGLTAGAYVNSYRRPSAYGGYTREWQIAGPLSVGGIAAAVCGYRTETGHRWTGMAGATVSWALTENARVRVIAAPKIGDGGHAVVHLTVAVQP